MGGELEKIDLTALIERLDDLESRRTPVGWSPDDAAERVAIERKIMALIAGQPSDERRRTLRVPCSMTVRVRTKKQTFAGEVKDIGPGGVFVATGVTLEPGTPVEVEVYETAEEHGLRVRGQVAWSEPKRPTGVGICFQNRPSAAHESRLRRFVLELLRHRIEQS